MMSEAHTTAPGADPRPRRSAERLIVFARYPEPGRTKTRLIPALGARGAADFQQRMTRRVLQTARQLKRRRGVEVEVRYHGGDQRAMAELFGNDLQYVAQAGQDLGRRMHGAFVDAFVAGCGRVVMIGSDCPGIDAERLEAALDALHEHDLVLGPAADGGYYLIGLCRPIPELFDGIRWGSEQVLAQTMERADRLGLVAHRLGVLSDIDRPEDLAEWHRVQAENEKEEDTEADEP